MQGRILNRDASYIDEIDSRKFWGYITDRIESRKYGHFAFTK
jgi:hypothetical protein